MAVSDVIRQTPLPTTIVEAYPTSAMTRLIADMTQAASTGELARILIADMTQAVSTGELARILKPVHRHKRRVLLAAVKTDLFEDGLAPFTVKHRYLWFE